MKLHPPGMSVPVPDTAPPLVYWPAVLAAAIGSLLLVAGATAVALAGSRDVPTTEESAPAPAGISDHELQPPSEPATNLRLVAATAAPAPPPPQDVARREPSRAQAPPVVHHDVAARLTPDQPLSPAPGKVCPVAAGPRPPGPSPADRPTYGTRLAFVPVPAEADREAARADKLVFLMHISGNFEDARFT